MEEKHANISLRGVDLLSFLGSQDANLRRLEDQFPGTLVVRGEELILQGPAESVSRMERIVGELLDRARDGQPLDLSTLDRILEGDELPTTSARENAIELPRGRRGAVRPRTDGQLRYLEALDRHDIVFATGPAGSGKTYLAVVRAVKALQSREVERIVLARPAVEAGEQLGFLPGDLQDKVDPYLRPLYDALTDCLGGVQLNRLLAAGSIEVAPLAYMRGRTLHRAFVILDEAQNTTLTQMKMFLTRLGENSKAVVTGDITQIDLAEPAQSGLVRVRPILADVGEVAFISLEEADVVRHPLVRRIVRAFDGPATQDEEPPS